MTPTAALLVRQLTARSVASRPRRARGRVVRPQPPNAVERQYRRVLMELVAEMAELVTQRILSVLPALAAEADQTKPDRADAWAPKLTGIVESVRQDMQRRVQRADQLVQAIARAVDEHNRRQWRRTVMSALGVPVTQLTRDASLSFGADFMRLREPWFDDVIGSFVSENVALIKTLPEDTVTRIEGLVQKGFRVGRDHREIAKDIRDQLGVAQNRAKIISRDQIGSINGQLTKLRNQEMGVTHYFWLATPDERTRPEHWARNGKRFAWDDPPEDGHPGEPILCRCTAQSDISELREQALRDVVGAL